MSEIKHTKLGNFFSTAICGNDILSSALYVAGIAALFSGYYAPIVLLLVAIVLFFYRSVYREVVEALPVNGGAYNGLLNGASKTVAATAGVMTILSYVATAVISAKTAIEYLLKFVGQVLEISGHSSLLVTLEHLILPFIVLILLAFAMLVISGVKDSAVVAAGIFSFHVLTLIVFVAFGAYFIFSGQSVLQANISATNELVAKNGGLLATFFLAFSASLLGISGFESSANFVEEQKPGVFKKTLTNMLVGVGVFNPLIALVVIQVLPLGVIGQAKDFLLAEASFNIGGLLFLAWIAIDAFLVLCGAVLTSYVGVVGLVNRMALDGCLPSVLLKENRKGSHPRIVMAFFLLCTSILMVTKGDLLSLAGVYTISFLGVMCLFAVGNMILRQTRTELKRPYKGPFVFTIIAFSATALGIVGNSLINPMNDVFFLAYFVPGILIVLVNIYKREVVGSLGRILAFVPAVSRWLKHKAKLMRNERIHVFIHNTHRIHQLLEYVNRNESGWNVNLVHCKNDKENSFEEIQQILPVLKKAGVYPHFKINLEYIEETFGPETVDAYVKKHKAPRNMIFIGSIHSFHEFDYGDFGGVRIIF